MSGAPGDPPVTEAAFRTDLPGAPGSVEALADALARGALTAVDAAARTAAEARAGVGTEWQGTFAGRAHVALADLSARAESAAGELSGVVRGLRAYADHLRTAQRGLAALREEARSAGLVVTGSLVSAPAGRECDLAPYLGRAREIYASVAVAATELGTLSLRGTTGGRDEVPALGALMLVPGAAAAVAQGRWTQQATSLRRRAAAAGAALPPGAPDPDPRVARWNAQADGLLRRGSRLTGGTTVVMAPIGVAADRAAGESWEQAAASQGAAAAAGAGSGAVAAGVTAAALTSWTGPGALVAGAVGFGVGAAAGAIANSRVDARYAAARARRTPEGLAERCGPGRPGSGRPGSAP